MLLSSSNRKYQPHPVFSYFPSVCAWDVCYIIFCHLLHIYSGITWILFLLLLRSLWWVQIVGCVLASRSYLFVFTLHHRIIIIVQTDLKTLNVWNACQIHFVECVSKIVHILSVTHYTIYGAVCFRFTHFPCDGWENTYTLSYYHHQIGSLNYYPLFRVMSWNNGMRCMSLYSLLSYNNCGTLKLCTWQDISAVIACTIFRYDTVAEI